MTTLSYQVHVLKSGKWETLKSFPPDDRMTAWSLFVSLQRKMGFAGKKLIEEAVKDNGLMYASTLSFRIFDPSPGGRKEGGGAPRRPRSSRSQSDRARPHGSRPGQRPQAAPRGVVDSLFGFFLEFGQKLIGLEDNLFRREKTEPVSRYGDPDQTAVRNATMNPRSTAYTWRYGDETDLSTDELLQAESAEVLGSAFFDFLNRNLVTSTLREDRRFHIGICCFAVGALIRIEDGVRLDSARGKALLNDTLRIFLLKDEAINSFIDRLATFLSQDASARFIKAGARCFEYFEVGKIDRLEQRFRETFDTAPADRTDLGEGTETGVVIVQICELAQIRDEFGRSGVQAVSDHLQARIAEVNAQFDAPILKLLGDSVMCGASSPDAMMMAVAELLASNGSAAGVPRHSIRVGAHFGPSVDKDGDPFGLAVQIGAALVSAAGPGEACILAEHQPLAEENGLAVRRTATLAIGGAKDGLPILHVS